MNPLIQREFLGILRTRQGFGAIVVLTCAFSLLVLARWPSDALVDLSGAQSRQVFRVFATACWQALCCSFQRSLRRRSSEKKTKAPWLCSSTLH
jgi:hypothetical protein